MAPKRIAADAKTYAWVLFGLGVASLACYAAIANQSLQFVPIEGLTDPVALNEKLAQRPILGVLGLFGISFLLYLAAVLAVRRVGTAEEQNLPAKPLHRRAGALFESPLTVVLVFAFAFRLIQAVANPIQEIDIYRYLWDGRVTLAGVNPYAYSPEDIEQGRIELHSPDGKRLADLLAHPSIRQIFNRVDHRNVPTVYPPASQAVFALTAAITPPDLPARQQVIWMKFVLLMFDFGVIGLMILLLRSLGKPAAWCVAYAWCPLVIKEVANSGHLDVIAFFFTTLAVLLLVRGRRYLGAVAWAAAILAKVYPIVLLPLIARQLWNERRWRGALGPLFLSTTMVVGTYWLAWPARSAATPFRGLQVFLAEWEMNDLIFHIVHKGTDAILGPELQQRLINRCDPWWPQRVATADAAELIPIQPAFVLAYLLTGLVLGAFIIWLAMRCVSKNAFVEGVFYAFVVMFLLSPTANPWYLLWALPFLPWARQWTWFLLPGIVFQYYLRFWFIYHYPEESGHIVFGTGLDGREFFNEVWLWVEYLPFFILLLVELVWQRKNTPTRSVSEGGRS